MHRLRSRTLGAMLAGSAMMLVQPASAQATDVDADVIPDPEGPTPAAGPVTQSASANQIIVTARRREEALQDTPIAITAINAAMLENKNSLNIGNLQGEAPNLLITQQNSGAAAANLSIRGLTYADIEKSQEPTVGVVIDGVFIGTNTGQLLDFFDIEQIEVLRGPQGTLFGRNTIGGVINIRRTRPTFEFGGKAEASYSRFGTWSTRAVLNFGVGDVIGFKPFYFHNETDGYYRDGVTGERRGAATNDNYGIAMAVQPNSDLDFLLTVEKQEQDFSVVNAVITNDTELFCGFAPPDLCNRDTGDDLYTVFGQPAGGTYNAPALTAELNWDTGPVRLTSVTGWRKSSENQTQDFDATPVDLYYTRRIQNYSQFSQEVRAAGDLFRGFDYVVGGYYFNSDFDLLQYTKFFGFAPDLDPLEADTNPQSVIGSTESYAVFGDFNWAFADNLRLSFGGRWTKDKKSLSNSFAQLGLVGQGEASFDKFTPKVGVDWRPNPDTMLYASWSRGYRSGGFSPRAATAATAGTPFGPETVDSYEIGTKLDLLQGRLQFNLAGFVSKYDGLQQNTTIPGGPTGNQTITSNVGSATIKGIEADATFSPVTGLRFNATIGYLDAQFDDFVAGNVVGSVILPFDYSANNPIYSPDLTASLGAEYVQPVSFGELVGTLGYRFIDNYDQQISLGPLSGDLVNGPVIVGGNDPRVRTDKQSLLDATLTANFALGQTDAYLSAFGRNLLDDRGANAAFTVAGLFSFASAREPRTYGVTAGVKF
ncbi:TonB-dependent receptor [Croceicoccus sp. F390]|uniref:TonB-dependent receptor n=1 Tax=Croceicoccus esteveae TaxID=3075597 RepID=A0ABU2ZH96_9SPHN|nr:TonB-dependent receptor [Croceicoccus sp. F390]MDT0575981.1 TonB-dependent receptor [Croceicoccus sp. F390]